MTKFHIDPDSRFFEEAFKFWFTDNGHLRSPFPDYMREALRENAIQRFQHFLKNLDDSAEDELDSTFFAAKLEQFLFEAGLELALTDDEKLTIQYPFLPRTGDLVKAEESLGVTPGEGKIVNRLIVEQDDKKYLQVECVQLNTREVWKTRFELPE